MSLVNDPTIVYEKLMRAVMLSRGARALRHRCRHCTVEALFWTGGGALPAVVLMHGFSASGPTQWGSVVRRIRGEVAGVLVPDLPGHGATHCAGELSAEVLTEDTAEALLAFVEQPALLVASSLSGGIAVRFALRHPERVAGLLLCSPGGAPMSPQEVTNLLDLFNIDSYSKALTFVDRVFGKTPLSRPLLAWGVMRQLRRPQLVKLLAQAREQRWLQPAELAALSMPVKLLWGAGDGVLPASSFAFYRDHLPPGTLIERPNYGHAPFFSVPAVFGASVLSFARRLALAPPRATRHSPAARVASIGALTPL
ncbi:MAG TPA: alpha/beta hydrolase [Sorangium sp.]|nr:alpha/beta hydrolase [Sorangium sp.]